MGCPCPAAAAQAKPSPDPSLVRLGSAIFLAGNSMVLSLATNLSELAPNIRLFFHVTLLAVTVLVLELVGGPLFASLCLTLRARRLGFDLFFATAIAGAMGTSIVAMSTGGAHVYFEVAAILAVVYAVGHRVSANQRGRALRAARSLSLEEPTCLVVTDCGHTREVPIEELGAGDRIVVYPGRRIPVDGVVVAGDAFVREAELTGEPFVTAKGRGAAVFAGSHCLDATLQIETVAGKGNRSIDRLARAVEDAWARPSPLQRTADRVAAILLPIVAAVALATTTAWSLRSGWEIGLFHGLAVLLVACPCAMGFATPVAMWTTISQLARHGIVVRGGDTVERLAQVTVAALDKTGTLTDAGSYRCRLVVADETPAHRAWLSALVEAAQHASDHPIAGAFRGIGADQAMIARFRVQDLRPLPARGLQTTVIDTKTGKSHALGVVTAEPQAAAAPPAGDGRELASMTNELSRLRRRLRAHPGARQLLIQLDGQLVAMAAVDERPRDHLSPALGRFTTLGIRPVLLTGDGEERACRLGIPTTWARLTPGEKRRHVRELAARGERVLYVGDGINDAWAMVESHVSVAPANGAPLARDIADALWHGHDLRRLPWAVEMARAAVRTIRRNLRFAALYNGIGVSVAAAGLLHPVFAAVLMTGSSLLVTWRASSTVEGILAAAAVSATGSRTAIGAPDAAPATPPGPPHQAAATTAGQKSSCRDNFFFRKAAGDR